jgi:serine/threonine protein kinase
MAVGRAKASSLGGGGRERKGKHSDRKRQRRFDQFFEMGPVIGKGSTAICHECRALADGARYACKVIDKAVVELRFVGQLDQFRVEVEALRALDHPNIITLVDVFESRGHIYMVTDLMEGGELFDYIVEKGVLSEREAAATMGAVTSAIAHMHGAGFIHRDLKPENLLISCLERGGTLERSSVKIIDFGLSKHMQGGIAHTETFLGSRGYLAPEMLRREEYSNKVDIWSLGVLGYILLCGCMPFGEEASGLTGGTERDFVLSWPSSAEAVSRQAKDLVGWMLRFDPRERCSAEQATEHPWLLASSGGGKGGRRGSKAPGGVDDKTLSLLLESPKLLRKVPLRTPRRKPPTAEEYFNTLNGGGDDLLDQGDGKRATMMSSSLR